MVLVWSFFRYSMSRLQDVASASGSVIWIFLGSADVELELISSALGQHAGEATDGEDAYVGMRHPS